MTAPDNTHRDLLVATRNPGKLRELRAIAAEWGLTPVTLSDVGLAPEPSEALLEDAATFEANALAKARHFFAAGGGRATIADDSGLEVDALGGAPGVRSRRWAGAVGSPAEVDATNNVALLRALDLKAERTARFVCVVAYVDARVELTCRGELSGRIAREPRGVAGFGYDPVFEVGELQWRTLGEVSSADKQRVSHRARAFGALADALRNSGFGRTAPDAGIP